MSEFISPFAELIIKYLKGELTDAEMTKLVTTIAQSDRNRKLFRKLTNPKWLLHQAFKLNTEQANARTEKAWKKYCAKVR